jgi:hypothetical protein
LITRRWRASSACSSTLKIISIPSQLDPACEVSQLLLPLLSILTFLLSSVGCSQHHVSSVHQTEVTHISPDYYQMKLHNRRPSHYNKYDYSFEALQGIFNDHSCAGTLSMRNG